MLSPVALDRRRWDRRTELEIDETIRVQGWAVVPMGHPQEADLPDEGEDADNAACHQDSSNSYAAYSGAVRERVALGQGQEIKCLLGRGWTALPVEVTNTLCGR